MNRRNLIKALAVAPTVALVPRFERINAELIWRTADGEAIPLSKIEDNHLRNIERYIRGDGSRVPPEGWRAEFHLPVVQELARRGLVPKPAYLDWDEGGDSYYEEEDSWA